MSIVPPHRMMINDVYDTPELSRGWEEGPQLVPSRVLVVLVEGTIAEDTPGRGCPGEDHEMSPLADTRKPSIETVSDDDSRSPCGGGHCPIPLLPGGSFRLMLQMHQRCLLRDLNRFPRGLRWCG